MASMLPCSGACSGDGSPTIGAWHSGAQSCRSGSAGPAPGHALHPAQPPLVHLQLGAIKTGAPAVLATQPSDEPEGGDSRHSEATHHAALLPHELHSDAPSLVLACRSGTATPTLAEEPSPQQRLPESPAPLPPPDAAEGPEAAAEYQRYLQRWEAGDTLAQRWHRLAAKGVVADIQAEWGEWQMDATLQQLRQSNASLAQPSKAAPAAAGGAVGGGRIRRGRGDLDGAADLIEDEPRRVRSRRAPNTLQDYHVDAPAAAAAAPGGDRQESGRGGGVTPELMHQQQQTRRQPGDASDDSAEEAAAVRQQQRAGVGAGRAHKPAPLKQGAASRRGGAVVPRSNAPQLPPPGSSAMATPAQHQALTAQQQQQVAGNNIPPEVLQEAYKVGARLGAAFLQQQDEGGGASMSKPAAMAAFVQAMCRFGGNPAMAQQMAAALASHQQQR